MTQKKDIKDGENLEEIMYGEHGTNSLDSTLGDVYDGFVPPEKDMKDEEIQFENEDELESPALALKKLREKLHLCEKEKKEYLDGWQRMRADFANVRKEEETRRGEMIKFASEGLVEDLLPVLDSFSMAFANKDAWENVDENWRKGVEYIYAQIYSTLESRGLTEIGKKGEPIDPRLHVTMAEVATSSEEQVHTIAEVIQKGYRLHSKVIRPAKVNVFAKTEA